MIDVKHKVPFKYYNSQDYQILLTLLDLVVNACKQDIDDFINLLNPSKCPDNMLPLLADYIGYDYDYNDSYEANRIILENYNNLMKNKGNQTGILLASALSLNSEDKLKEAQKLSLFRIEYIKYKIDNNGNYILDDKGNKILNDTMSLYIYYPSYLKKLRDLVELVRPVGLRIKFIPALNIDTEEKINMNDYVELDVEKYANSKRSEISNNVSNEAENNDKLKELSRIGFSEIDNYSKGE